VAYVVSRLLVFIVMSVGSQVEFVKKVESNTLWETRIVYSPARLGPELERLAMIGDAWWYRWIAVDGYSMHPFDERPANWAFFPLFPLVVRFARITGNFAFDAAIVSNLALLAALILLRDVAIRTGLDADAADRAVFYLAFFPTSYFLSLPMSESLFLLLSLASFNAAQRQRWWLAGIAGALATATRAAGILLLPALLVREKPRPAMFWLAAIPAALGAYMTFLYFVTGNAFAFADVQVGWGRHPGWFFQPLLDYVRHPFAMGERWNLLAFNFIVAILLIATALVLFKGREWSMATYVLGSALMPLSSGSLQSLGRYAVVVFPLFLLLGRAGRRPLLHQALLAGSALLLGVFVALFVLRVDFALA